MINSIAKYPRTPYSPWSPQTSEADRVIAEMSNFIGRRVVITEKLDGANVTLYDGRAFTRGMNTDRAPWLGMVKKHHAWKTSGARRSAIHGEDIYAVHSIKYDPVPERRTFYVFALRDVQKNVFESFDKTVSVCKTMDFATVPILYDGEFESGQALRGRLELEMSESSGLGGEREGVVVRIADGFPVREFERSICKLVRVGHIQTDTHWRRNWKPCKISREVSETA